MNYKPTLVSTTSDNDDMVHEIDAQTKAILVELTADGQIVFYVDGRKVDANQYIEHHKASIDFHKIMDFIQQTIDRAPHRGKKQ